MGAGGPRGAGQGELRGRLKNDRPRRRPHRWVTEAVVEGEELGAVVLYLLKRFGIGSRIVCHYVEPEVPLVAVLVENLFLGLPYRLHQNNTR